MTKDNGQIIQAFPISASTYVGTPTALPALEYSVIHCNEAVSLVFDFGSTPLINVAAEQGQDFAFKNCVAISATGEVVLS